MRQVLQPMSYIEVHLYFHHYIPTIISLYKKNSLNKTHVTLHTTHRGEKNGKSSEIQDADADKQFFLKD